MVVFERFMSGSRINLSKTTIVVTFCNSECHHYGGFRKIYVRQPFLKIIDFQLRLWNPWFPRFRRVSESHRFMRNRGELYKNPMPKTTFACATVHITNCKMRNQTELKPYSISKKQTKTPSLMMYVIRDSLSQIPLLQAQASPSENGWRYCPRWDPI